MVINHSIFEITIIVKRRKKKFWDWDVFNWILFNNSNNKTIIKQQQD